MGGRAVHSSCLLGVKSLQLVTAFFGPPVNSAAAEEDCNLQAAWSDVLLLFREAHPKGQCKSGRRLTDAWARCRAAMDLRSSVTPYTTQVVLRWRRGGTCLCVAPSGAVELMPWYWRSKICRRPQMWWGKKKTNLQWSVVCILTMPL